MRIAIVSERASPLAAPGGAGSGGQGIHVAALASQLASRGHDVTVFTRRDHPSAPERLPFRPGAEVVHVDAGPAQPIPEDELLPFLPEFANRLDAYWQLDPPDIVHSHFWGSGAASLDAARRSSSQWFPVVHTFHALGAVKRRHEGRDGTTPPERETLERRIGREADAVIATCTDEAFELIPMGVESSRLSVVPYGVDTKLFTPHGPKEDKRRPFRIVSVGRLVPREGVDLVITALAKLARRGRDDIEFVVVGGSRPAAEVHEDPDVTHLLAHANHEGVADLVSFRGRIDQSELPAILRSADMVVCAPWYEPFGIVPLEAMATGVPVVAAAVGGHVDTVVHGRTGLHVAPRDPESLENAIEALLTDPPARMEFGRAGVKRVSVHYTWRKIAADTERAYLKTLARAAAAPLAATETGG